MPNCFKCNDTGYVYEKVRETCYSCGGTGKVGSTNTRCMWCNGSGYKENHKNVRCNHCFGVPRNNPQLTNVPSNGESNGCVKALKVIIIIWLAFTLLGIILRTLLS